MQNRRSSVPPLVWCVVVLGISVGFSFATPSRILAAQERVAALRAHVPPSILDFDTAATMVVRGTATGRLPEAASDPIDVTFVAYGQIFDLELIPYNLHTDDAKVRIHTPEGVIERDPIPTFYTGGVRGAPGARVAVGLALGGLTGFVQMPDDVYVLEPSRRFDAAAPVGELIVYRGSDFVFDPDEFYCPLDGDLPSMTTGDGLSQTDDLMGRLTAGWRGLVGWLLPTASAESITSAFLRKVDIAIVADQEFTNMAPLNGDVNATEAEMQNIIGILDNTMLRDTDTTVRIAVTDVFPAEPDPFPPHSPNDPRPPCAGKSAENPLISALQTFRNDEKHDELGIGVTHLFTGANPIGCAGYALGTLCETFSSVSFREPFSSNPTADPLYTRAYLSGHELGHNFSAIHDDCQACGPYTIPKRICRGGPNDGANCFTGPCNPPAANCSPGDCIINPEWGNFLMSSGWNNPDLPYSSCSKPRIINRFAEKLCSGGPLNGFRCFTASDCPGGTCAASGNDVSCIVTIECGDVTRSGSITSADALAAQQLANCSTCAYDGLADVEPANNPEGDIDQADVDLILDIAVGNEPVPSVCGLYQTP